MLCVEHKGPSQHMEVHIVIHGHGTYLRIRRCNKVTQEDQHVISVEQKGPSQHLKVHIVIHGHATSERGGGSIREGSIPHAHVAER